MTTQDIFKKVTAHAVKGLMIHQQMAQLFDFLGLSGYAYEQKYHYLDESRSFQKLHDYFIENKNMLIPEERVENPAIIPASWYAVKRMQVDNGTRKEYTKKAFELWRAWEDEAKSTYQTAKSELVTNGDHSAALFINDYIKNTATELAQVNYKILQLSAKDYDLVEIANEQETIKSRFKNKLR